MHFSHAGFVDTYLVSFGKTHKTLTLLPSIPVPAISAILPVVSFATTEPVPGKCCAAHDVICTGSLIVVHLMVHSVTGPTGVQVMCSASVSFLTDPESTL